MPWRNLVDVLVLHVLVGDLSHGLVEVPAHILDVLDVLPRVGEGLTRLHIVVIIRVRVADGPADRVGERSWLSCGVALAVLW